MIDAEILYSQLKSVVVTTRQQLIAARTRMAAGEYSYAEFNNNVSDVNASILITQEALAALNGADGEEFRLWLNARLLGVSKTLSAWQTDFTAMVNGFKAFNTTIDNSITSIESASGYIQGEQWALNADGTGKFTPRVFSAAATSGLRGDIDDIITAVANVIVG
jgi:hypothetical protein